MGNQNMGGGIDIKFGGSIDIPKTAYFQEPLDIKNGAITFEKFLKLTSSRVAILDENDYFWWTTRCTGSPQKTSAHYVASNPQKPQMEYFLAAICRDRFVIEGNDITALIPYAVLHEQTEAYYKQLHTIVDRSPNNVAHQHAREMEFRQAVTDGMDAQLLSFFEQVAYPEEFEVCKAACAAAYTWYRLSQSL